MPRTCSILFLALSHWILSGCSEVAFVVRPIPEQLRVERELAAFYQKQTSVAGFPILGSANVEDATLREAAWILRHMLVGRDDIFAALTENGVHLAVMAYSEYTSDVPEQADLKPRVYWDRRARGLGGPPVSCAEENLLSLPGDPYSTENILIHEFAHIVHASAMETLDPTFDERLRGIYEQALAAGRWAGTYAATDRKEFWAEAVQSWFDDNRENDSLHNHVNTRAELREYEPALAALCEQVLGDGEWRYLRPRERDDADRVHLSGFDFDNPPRFEWREEPVPLKPLVSIQTALGNIEVVLDYERAPVTVANFLHYVHQGFYADGSFFRVVRADNQPGDGVKIAVIQGCADLTRRAGLLPPIVIERTRDTGLRHEDGVISMARSEPDSARHHFFICVGDQPELDFGGKRNPDGQGFAAFGRVVKNMELVRRIHDSPAEGQTLVDPVLIQRAIRMN